MSMFRSRRPRRSSKAIYWDRVKLEPGKSICGWCAGPVAWAPTHWEDTAIGCRAALTNGHLPCRYCVAQFATRWRGCMPFYDQHGGHMVSVFGDTFDHLVDGIVRGDPIRVTKTIRQGCPIRVEKWDWTAARTPLLDDEPGDVDASALWVRMWQDDELAAWLCAHPGELPEPPVAAPVASDKPVSLGTPALTITVKPDGLKAAEKRQAEKDAAAHASAAAEAKAKGKAKGKGRAKPATPPANEPDDFATLYPNLINRALNGHGGKNGKK